MFFAQVIFGTSFEADFLSYRIRKRLFVLGLITFLKLKKTVTIFAFITIYRSNPMNAR